MSEQKPDNKFIGIAKMVVICIICFGAIYGIVSLITFLSA